MKEQLIAAEVAESEYQRRSRLLNILILSLAGALAVFTILVLVLQLPSQTSSLISISSGMVLCGVSYLLVRTRRLTLAAYVFLGGFIVVANTSILLPNIPVETRIVGPLPWQ